MKKYIQVSVLLVAMLFGVNPVDVRAMTTVTLVPTFDVGPNQWTVVGGGPSHHSVVDDNPCNGATDYVESTVSGEQEWYMVDLSSMVPAGVTITGVGISLCAANAPSITGPQYISKIRAGFSYSDGGAPITGQQDYPVTSTTFTQLPVLSGL